MPTSKNNSPKSAVSSTATATESVPVTLTYRITGAVQGVGFRPFVYRLARELGIAGWVRNDVEGVTIQAMARTATLKTFEARLRTEAPPAARITSVSTAPSKAGETAPGFRIMESETGGARTAEILPDLATCPDCLKEVFDPSDRRHLYPFTNCTNCGPRFSILERIPYDRPNTTMKQFTMCERCRKEYEDPANRRFHAQPNACPDCGPHLELWNPAGKPLALHHQALLAAASAIRDGQIAAVKGLGGFHLMVDARNDEAVRRLRARKHREEKPFALMYPWIESVKADCQVSDTEEHLLRSMESPIVLLRRKKSAATVASSVAPANPYFGILLPYTPLHHILMKELGFPVVATSGNLSDEPICTDEHEAVRRLGGIADVFLVHNRPIARHVDDSIVRVVGGEPMVMRRARGYAPRPIAQACFDRPILAVGAHLKNTVALAHHGTAVISQHIGDLETLESSEAFKKAILVLEDLYETAPREVACDLHPDYLSTKYAQELGLRIHAIQHHHAHVAACMAENNIDGRVLGVSWDGTGYGTDGTVWGGEFLLADRKSFVRAGCFRPFRLPGGETAIKEPRRSGLGVLFEMLGDEAFAMTDCRTLGAFSAKELKVIGSMLRKSVNAPITTSVGRLFDAVASLVGIKQVSTFEGQAAMGLEFALEDSHKVQPYGFELTTSGPAVVVDWAPMIRGVLDDLRQGSGSGLISARFHSTFPQIVLAVSRTLGERRVVLSGGCFQNGYLAAKTVEVLRAAGISVYSHREIPTNDGGISFGQLVVASAQPR